MLRVLDTVQIPGMQYVSMGLNGASKAKGLLDVQRAMTGGATMPKVDPKSSLLPLLGAPSLLNLTNH